MRALCILMILLLPVQPANTATAAPNCGPGPAEPAPGLELNVDITEDSMEVQVTESQPGMGQFHGTVTVQMPSLRGAEVTLSSTTDIGWVSKVSPGTLVLDNGQTGSFTVNVVVPQGTSASQTGNLEVYGRAVASGVQATGSDTAGVTVRPYYRVVLEPTPGTAEIAPGGTARFSVKVINAGNSVDSFSLQFTNLADLRKQGWTLGRTTNLLDGIDPGGYRTVVIALTAPVSLSPYMNKETTLAVRALSEGAREHNLTIAVDYHLVAKEAGVSVPGVGAVAVIAAVIAVGVVMFWRRRRRMRLEAGEEAPVLPPEGTA